MRDWELGWFLGLRRSASHVELGIPSFGEYFPQPEVPNQDGLQVWAWLGWHGYTVSGASGAQRARRASRVDSDNGGFVLL